MRRTYPFISIVVLIALAVFAYAAKAIPTTCSVCNAKISEENRKYSAYIVEGMEANAFDDIGCAVIWYADQCGMRSGIFDSNAMVYDFASVEPIPAEKAFYVQGADIKTPKGYGIVAFKTKDAAKKFAQEQGGRVADYQEISSLKLK